MLDGFRHNLGHKLFEFVDDAFVNLEHKEAN